MDALRSQSRRQRREINTMQAIRTVNLIWERRARGGYPASPYALANDGTLLRAIPRPLESRAYDLVRVAPDESATQGGFFSAETLLKLEVAQDAEIALGMTSDDIYLFRDGGKTRFLGERQQNYLDASLDASGQTLAVSYCDVAGTHFGLACGSISGRVAWQRESDAAIPAVAVSRDGKFIAYGAEDGAILLVSTGLSDIWSFEQAEPIRAVACSEDGSFAAYGTAGGAVGLIDASGARKWETRFSGEIAALALSSDDGLCAVIVHPKDGGAGAKLACLTENGQIGWEYNTEKRLLRASVSANGRYVAAGSRDGTATVYEIVPSEMTGGGVVAGWQDATIRNADALAKSGDLRGAMQILRTALNANPSHAELCEQLNALREQWRAEREQSVAALLAALDFTGAIDAAERWLQDDPRHTYAIQTLNLALTQQANRLLTDAQTMDSAQAEAALKQALTYDFYFVEARRELGILYSRRIADADAEAEAAFAKGEMDVAVSAWERAQSVAPSAERARKITRAQTAAEFAAGMTLYNEKRYEQAIFQFRKALARDPNHSDAKRYLNFAQKFAQNADDQSQADRFDFLE